MAEDPRVARTRRRLKRALLELIDEGGYEAITVDALAERADVARSTFYAHYGAKEDLLFAGFEEWLLSFRVRADPCPDLGFRFSLPLFRHAASQRRFFEATIVRGPSHRVRRRLKEILARVAATEMEAAGVLAAGTAAAEARGRAVAGAFLGLLEWWFEDGERLEPQDVDGLFQATVAPAPRQRG